MRHIKVSINGVPNAKNKTRGDTNAPNEWSRKVVEQTKHLPKITLTKRDAVLFARSLVSPPAPSRRLRAAAYRYRRVVRPH